MPNTRFDLEDQIAALLPTPVVNDMGSDKTIEWWEAWTKKIGGHGGFTEYRDEEINWGKYNGAIRRWELVLNRAAPDPTISGVNGRPRLSPLFVEWMMGLPEGWVTGHGLSVAKELKALGNGVCPQQAFLALQLLIGDEQ
jgi:DNA (cytosine-5)-methyltransferase 1